MTELILIDSEGLRFMNLRNIIENDYKESIKDKNQDKTNTLRLIKSAIKDKQIQLRGKQDKLLDTDILSLLQTLIKQRKDSIDAFAKANRKDLIEKEQSEIKVIEIFLPQQKNEDETKEIIEGIIKENNLTSIKDMGTLMNMLKNKFTGQIDMGVAGKIAKSSLGN